MRLWGVETPHEKLVLAVSAPHSLTYGRGACGVCNRFTRTKGYRDRLVRFSNSPITRDQGA